MKLLITGSSGLLGSKIAEIAQTRNHEVYSAYAQHYPIHGKATQLDISKENEVIETFKKIDPEAVIHTAALTDVDKCEKEKDLALKINAEATKNIAVASACIDSHVTYVSTDYVFNGKKGLYKEADKTNPISYYGYTKLKGEEFIKQHATKWCIARASVLYGWSDRRQNFATWLLESLTRNKSVRVPKDQYVSPTLNTNLAEMLLEVSQQRVSGILHTAGATRTSRYEYALMLAQTFDLKTDLVKPAGLREMPWKAERPRDSSLNVNRATSLLNAKPLALDEALAVLKKEKPAPP